tara:strand:+ start:112 stop:363 length:252 start_codon:yes stop_codon:yes gene_type:complete
MNTNETILNLYKKGEYKMTARVVEHKIKLEKSVKIILAVLAVGVFLNAFAPVFDVKDAFARGQEVHVTNFPVIQTVDCLGGCR